MTDTRARRTPNALFSALIGAVVALYGGALAVAGGMLMAQGAAPIISPPGSARWQAACSSRGAGGLACG